MNLKQAPAHLHSNSMAAVLWRLAKLTRSTGASYRSGDYEFSVTPAEGQS